MKTNKETIRALFAVLLIVILFLCFYFPNKITEMKHSQQSFIQFTGKIQAREDFLRSNFELNSQMTGLKAPEMFCMITYSEGRLLSEMAKYNPVLIYWFTRQSCNDCIIDALTELEKEIQNEVSENRDFVKILCSHETDRELMILRRTYKFSFPIYKVPSDAFKWVVEDNRKPYYFLVHPDMRISHIYVPDKEFPELNKLYLEGVKRFLLD